jgi:hypothetical protein
VTRLAIIVIVAAVLGFVGIVGWRAGGMRGQKLAREAERNKELDE